MEKCINDLLKGQLLGFSGTLLQSVNQINIAAGNYAGIIKGIATFRQFKARNGNHAGELFGVLEVMTELDNGTVIPVRTDKDFEGYIGQRFNVTVSKSGEGEKYTNAVFSGPIASPANPVKQ